MRQHRFLSVFGRFAPFSGGEIRQKTSMGLDVMPVGAWQPRLKTAKTVPTAERMCRATAPAGLVCFFEGVGCPWSGGTRGRTADTIGIGFVHREWTVVDCQARHDKPPATMCRGLVDVDLGTARPRDTQRGRATGSHPWYAGRVRTPRGPAGAVPTAWPCRPEQGWRCRPEPPAWPSAGPAPGSAWSARSPGGRAPGPRCRSSARR